MLRFRTLSRRFELRAARSHDDSAAAMAALRRQLRSNGFVLFHGFVSALARPNHPSRRDGVERQFPPSGCPPLDAGGGRLAIELDAKTVAYALSQDSAIDQVMAAAGVALRRR